MYIKNALIENGTEIDALGCKTACVKALIGTQSQHCGVNPPNIVRWLFPPFF